MYSLNYRFEQKNIGRSLPDKGGRTKDKTEIVRIRICMHD